MQEGVKNASRLRKMWTIQYAQNNKIAIEKITKNEKVEKKLSTSKSTQKWKEVSYTRSYSHYPQKMGKKNRFT